MAGLGSRESRETRVMQILEVLGIKIFLSKVLLMLMGVLATYRHEQKKLPHLAAKSSSEIKMRERKCQ